MKDDNQEKISCHICQKEIPKAAALHAEGQDYVLHFCDITCLDFWKKENPPEKKSKSSNKA